MPLSSFPTRFPVVAISLLVAATAVLSSCSAQRGYQAVPAGITTVAPENIELTEARSQNISRSSSEQFQDTVRVIDDPSGIQTVDLFFPNSQSLIIAQDEDAALLRAASLAISQHVPMVVYSDTHRLEINRLIEKLAVTRILLVGKVPYLVTDGDLRIMQDPGTDQGLGQLTAFEYQKKVVDSPSEAVQAIANVEPQQRVELRAQWKRQEKRSLDKVGALPAQSARDGKVAPIVIATPNTPIAQAANARAFGAALRVMPTGDPRDSKAAYAMVIGLDRGNLVALGPDFQNAKLLSDRIRQGWSE